MNYDPEFDNNPEIEAEAREAVADVVSEEFDRHADYDWDNGFDEGPYDYLDAPEVPAPVEPDTICTICDGTGEHPEDHLCKACAGKGHVDVA